MLNGAADRGDKGETGQIKAYGSTHFVYNSRHALVAQLDRVLPSEGSTQSKKWSREQI